MNTRTKVIIDDWLGRAFVYILNVVARILGKILRIDHSLQKPPARIVVCKFLGMGSIIQSTPLLQTLRKQFPKAEIIFLTSTGNRKLLESVGVIDIVYDIDDTSIPSILRTTFLVLRSFWEKKPELYIDLETYSFFSTAVATMSCAKNRFGFYRVERNIRMGVYTHMMFFNPKAPISESYLQMARLAGCKQHVHELYPFIITESDRMSSRRKLVTLTGSFSGKYILVNINASDLRVERRWPADHFVELIRILNTDFPDHTILLTGAENEKRWVRLLYEKLYEQSRKLTYNTAGLFTLYELFALVEMSVMVVTNDTGPMHISFALNKPTVCLFGPASSEQFGKDKNAFSIYKNIYCSPCVHDFLTPPCCGDNQCMKMISVKEVEKLCRDALSGKQGYSVVSDEISFHKLSSETVLGVVQRN